MRRMVMMLGVVALMVALSAGSALAKNVSCPNDGNAGDGKCIGTNVGDGMFGTSLADNMYGLGGADLMYGYGSADFLYGGNETGFGDKILGGAANDRVAGQGGNDALYGGSENDRVLGGLGNDLIVGGPGNDTLNGGPDSDQVNAQDGQKDTIVLCGNENDRIFYDRGIDVLQGCVSPQADGANSATLSASEAKAGDFNLSTGKPPAGLFDHTGKVLVDHEGSKKCVAAKEVKAHTKHGDAILNPAGCSGE